MKTDLGLSWAKLLVILGQVGAIYGMVNSIMLIGIFYMTTIRPEFGIPLWPYLLAVIFVIISLVSFILKIGISGYYRFFNQQSAIDRIDQKLDWLIKNRH